MVIEFDKTFTFNEATNDRQKIYKRLKKPISEEELLSRSGDFSRANGSAKSGAQSHRLFTDGVDTTSYKASYDSTLLQAEEADA